VELLGLPSSITVRRAVLDGAAVRLEGHGTAVNAPCPTCGAVGTRVHSRYVRRPMDLPWRGWTVRLVIAVRRFRCDVAACPRATFAEPIAGCLPRRERGGDLAPRRRRDPLVASTSASRRDAVIAGPARSRPGGRPG
jgi:transposase